MANVGFIGLGNIGGPMARHLLKGDFSVHVYDVFPEAAADVVKQGAVLAGSVAELAVDCPYIGVCVRDDRDVENLLHGPADGSAEGLLAAAKPGTIIALHSTVTQDGLFKWVEEAKAYNIELIDAPMTGGASVAEAGELCYMVGGSAAQLERVRPMLETSAEKIIHAGDIGHGIALKLCNNLITWIEFTAMSEATRLAEACGLSADVLREVGMSNGVINEKMHSFVTGRNAMAAACTEEQMEQFFGGFGRLGRKDMDCAIETAAKFDIRLPATEFVRDIIELVFLNKI